MISGIRNQHLTENLITSAVFIGVAFFAGSKRCIEYFPGASKKTLLASAGISSLALMGSRLKFPGDSRLEIRNRIIYSLSGIALSNIAVHWWSKGKVTRSAINRLVGFEGISYVVIATAFTIIKLRNSLQGLNDLVSQKNRENAALRNGKAQQEYYLRRIISQISEENSDIRYRNSCLQEQLIELHSRIVSSRNQENIRSSMLYKLPREVLSVLCLYINISDIQATALSCHELASAIRTETVQSGLIKQFDRRRSAADIAERLFLFAADLESLQLSNLGHFPTRQEILIAYRQLARIHHPDKPNGDEAMFRQITYAKEALLAELI